MPSYQEDMAVMREYVERLGPLPDMRAMSAENAEAVPDKCRAALEKGLALTLEEWGVPDDIPDGATI